MRTYWHPLVFPIKRESDKGEMISGVGLGDRKRLLHRPVVFDVVKVGSVRVARDVRHDRRHRVTDRVPRPAVVLKELV